MTPIELDQRQVVGGIAPSWLLIEEALGGPPELTVDLTQLEDPTGVTPV